MLCFYLFLFNFFVILFWYALLTTSIYDALVGECNYWHNLDLQLLSFPNFFCGPTFCLSCLVYRWFLHILSLSTYIPLQHQLGSYTITDRSQGQPETLVAGVRWAHESIVDDIRGVIRVTMTWQGVSRMMSLRPYYKDFGLLVQYKTQFKSNKPKNW